MYDRYRRVRIHLPLKGSIDLGGILVQKFSLRLSHCLPPLLKLEPSIFGPWLLALARLLWFLQGLAFGACLLMIQDKWSIFWRWLFSFHYQMSYIIFELGLEICKMQRTYMQDFIFDYRNVWQNILGYLDLVKLQFRAPTFVFHCAHTGQI